MSEYHYLTVPEAAARVKMGTSTLRRHIRDGTGPRVCKLGYLVRVRTDDLEAWARGEVDHSFDHNRTETGRAKVSKSGHVGRAVRA